MRFNVLGAFGATVGEEPLALGPPQQQKLLAVLCTSPNRPVSSDRLVDEVWGDTPPPSAGHLIQVYVSRLRGILGNPDGTSRITREGSGYMIRVDPTEIDSHQLEALIDEASRLVDDDPATSLRMLRTATDMWAGRPFGELGDESELLRSEATRLTEAYLGALESRIDLELKLGQHKTVVAELERLANQHPYRERFWEQWMLALYRSGRQAEALRCFQELSRTLGEDLGIVPSPGAVELEERILLHDPALLWERPPPPSNLPAILTTFVGRGAEMAAVSKLLETSRLVTLTGPGGIGKTRLAAETARRILLRYPDGIWWIDLAPISNPEMVAAEVARTLGVSAQPGKTIEQSVAQSLVRREALLIFDNCEHVAAAAAEVIATSLQTARHIRILATSRSPLHVIGESMWIVPALSMPLNHGATEDSVHSDAVRLFLERATAIKPSYRFDPQDATVIEICRRLDGMPLAIEMAAARLRVLSPHEIASSLVGRFAVLKRPERDVTPRHATLQAAIDWSYGLLSPYLQTAFNNLSVFPGSFDLPAASAVAFSATGEQDALEVMSNLVDASMVARVDDAAACTRFRLLETIREYGRQHLREAGNLGKAWDTHARYFVEIVEEATGDIGEVAFVAWLDRINRCYDDIQQTLEWSQDNDESLLAIRMAPVLQHYWYRTGDAREALRWGLSLAASDDAAPYHLAAAAHTAASFGATILTDPETAIHHADTAIELYAETSDRRGLTTSLFGRANAALLVGDFDTLRHAGLECLRISDEIGFSWGRAGALSLLGFAQFFGGDSLSEARALAEEAVSVFRELGDVAGQTVMNPVSGIALQQGDVAAAERYALETAAIGRESSWEATALVNLAEVYLAKGDLDRAETMLQRGVTRALDTGLENWFRVALRDLAQVAVRRGQPAQAATLLGASRRNMPEWGLIPAIYEAVETECLRALDKAEFQAASDEGYRSDLEQLLHQVFHRAPWQTRQNAAP